MFAPQDPTYAIAHYNLGVALQSKNRLAEAISAYRNAVQHRENYADAYNNMGYALQAQGHLDEAIDAYRSAIRTRPDFANARSNLEKVLELQKKRGSKPAPAASSGSMGGFSDDGTSSERGSMERKSSIMGSLFGEVSNLRVRARAARARLFLSRARLLSSRAPPPRARRDGNVPDVYGICGHVCRSVKSRCASRSRIGTR